MGLNDKGVANNWVYSNGDTSGLVFLVHEELNVKKYFSFTNWDMGQPLDFEPYNCAHVSPYGSWQSGRCDIESNFFCMLKSMFEIFDHIFIYGKYLVFF